MTYLCCLTLLLVLVKQPKAYGHFLAVPPVNIMSSYRVCPEMKEILHHFRRNISITLSELLSGSISECGDGLWYRVAYLDMTDPSQQCPPAWREYNTSGVRACGRPVSSGGSRPANFYTVDRQYSRVCGRIIGYQVGSPDGFRQFHSMTILDHNYMDGISITQGNPRHHIWSYVASVYEINPGPSSCPCSSAQGYGPPEFIGNNYYCESGNPDETSFYKVFFSTDPLWDGEQCEGTCCSGTKSPPWFSVQLPTHTTDRIEVRICADESTNNEDTPVQILEIYVQ